MRHVFWTTAACLALTGMAAAQTVPVTNPSFEEFSAGHFPGWHLNTGKVTPSTDAPSGQFALRMDGTPDATVFCTSGPLDLAPLAAYAMRYKVKVTPYTSGVPVAGPRFSNAIMYELRPDAWHEVTLYFQTPSGLDDALSRVRVGHARLKGGSVLYDDVEVYRVYPVHAGVEDIELGIGESVRGNRYECIPAWDATKSNVCRPTVDYPKSMYNWDTYLMGDGSSLVMRHEVGNRNQTSAVVRLQPRYYFGGELIVEAGTDGAQWREIGRIASETAGMFEVPGDLLPARSVWIRMRVESDAPVGADLDLGAMGIAVYHYDAQFDGEPVPYTEGTTAFVGVTHQDPALTAQVVDIGEGIPGGANAFSVDIENHLPEPVTGTVVSATRLGGQRVQTENDVRLDPGHSTLRIPYELLGMGENEVTVRVGDPPLLELRYQPHVAAVFDAAYGEHLPGSTEETALWWAPSGYKVSTNRPAPEAAGTALRLAAARNETEAAQFVLRSATGLTGLTAVASDLTGPAATIPGDAVTLLQVAYVYVHTPTDTLGAVGHWPDPLLPLTAPIDVPAGQNQPIWVRVAVPRDVPAGLYEGVVTLHADGYAAHVPVVLEVFGFTLPDRTTVETAFGVSMERVAQYQKPATQADRETIRDRYFDAMASFRLSPYDPAPLTPFGVTWPDVKPGDDVDPGDLHVTFDWDKWDAAVAHALETWHFNAMCFGMPGAGSSNHRGELTRDLLGFNEDTPEFEALFRSYTTQFEAHLREKGWLDMAYIYWFDEPGPEHYAHVMEGMQLLKNHAPGLRRILTEQVEPELVGGPNLWCPMIDTFQPELADERRAAGDQFWWYVCTVPKQPYVGLFIDRPATDLRVWLWQTWQYGIEGVLIWETCYWTSPGAFPDHPQNPYEDPMGWNSEHRVKTPWGNGDGRLFYPPRVAADASPGAPVLDGPVATQRIEMLRDGIEDFEYFAMLRRLLDDKGDRLEDAQRAEYEALLTVPEAVSVDRKEYTTRPEPIEAHRMRLARAIAHVNNL